MVRKFFAYGLDEYDCKPNKGMDIWAEDVGDRHHTMSELYNHRFALFYALTKLYDNYLTPIGTRVKCFKSRNHHPNNDPMFEDSFIVWMEVNKLIGPMDIISYHLPISWWDKFKLMERDNAPLYDGYSSEDVLKRIMML